MKSSLHECHDPDVADCENVSGATERPTNDAWQAGSHQWAGMREQFLDCYINLSISNELSGWLADLGLPFTGTVEQKLACLKEHRGALPLAAESLHRQTIFYLNDYSVDMLVEICQELGLKTEGSRGAIFKRIYCEVGLREGWLWPIPQDTKTMLKQMFLSVIQGFDMDRWNRLWDLLQEEQDHLSTPLAFGRAFIVVLIPELLREAYATMLDQKLGLTGTTS